MAKGGTSKPRGPFALDLPKLDRTVARFVGQGLVPGVALAWREADGPIRYSCVGELDFGGGRAVDERSIFRIFSQTKPITGIAAMMLIEDGAVSLDQPLADILGDFADMRVVVGDNLERTRPAARPITIRHLLTHTAGFGMAGMTLGSLYQKHGITPGNRGRIAGPGELRTPQSLAEMANRLASLPLAADPGERFDYSVALDVLGLVIETVSGLPFDEFLQCRLFEPLGMVDTGFSVTATQASRFAALPERTDAGFILADDPRDSVYARPGYPSGGGGLVSTAHDYARFAAMLLNEGELDGARVLRPETVRLARSSLLPAGVDRVDLPLGQTLSGVGFGAGMSVQVAPGRRTGGQFDWPGDVPAGVFGWPGSAGTACWIDPERGCFLLFLTQYWPSWINGSLRPEVIAAAYGNRPAWADEAQPRRASITAI
jgi:CubicO group peptidase (beta-lactamase class C family)